MAKHALIALVIALVPLTVTGSPDAKAQEHRATIAARVTTLTPRLGKLRYPAAVQVARNGNLYILDAVHQRIVVTSGRGQLKTTWRISAPARTQWESGALALDARGNVYQADAVDNVIVKFSPEGRKLAVFGRGEIKGPQGIAIAKNGNVVVSNALEHTVGIFDPQGRLIRKFGKEGTEDGQFRYPVGIALDGHDNIYVADFINARVQVFSPEGRFLRKWGTKGDKPGQFATPYGIAIDGKQRVWVSDSGFDRIQSFDLNGARAAVLAMPSKAALNHPKGLAVTPHGALIIANTGGHSVDTFTLSSR